MSVMNEDNIELSIIIPVYNNEKLVIKCLDSIKNQKIQNYECIIIDDGSTDGSLGICEEYAKNNNNFRVIRKKMVAFHLQETLASKIPRGSMLLLWILMIIYSLGAILPCCERYVKIIAI